MSHVLLDQIKFIETQHVPYAYLYIMHLFWYGLDKELVWRVKKECGDF